MMDCRHPLKELDLKLIDLCFHRDLSVHILLTKSDKISRSELSATLLKVRKHFELVEGLVTVQTFSSLKKEGLEELIKQLNAWFYPSNL